LDVREFNVFSEMGQPVAPFVGGTLNAIPHTNSINLDAHALMTFFYALLKMPSFCLVPFFFAFAYW
jgi:hypothetical protein